MADDEFRAILRDELRTILKGETAAIKKHIDSTYDDFARALRADASGVQAENVELKTKLAAAAKIVTDTGA